MVGGLAKSIPRKNGGRTGELVRRQSRGKSGHHSGRMVAGEHGITKTIECGCLRSNRCREGLTAHHHCLSSDVIEPRPRDGGISRPPTPIALCKPFEISMKKFNNAENRDEWIKSQLLSLEPGTSLLDVGAGECPYKPFREHLDYVSQDVDIYDRTGNQKGL